MFLTRNDRRVRVQKRTERVRARQINEIAQGRVGARRQTLCATCSPCAAELKTVRIFGIGPAVQNRQRREKAAPPHLFHS